MYIDEAGLGIQPLVWPMLRNNINKKRKLNLKSMKYLNLL
jgi:hypothetical protein